MNNLYFRHKINKLSTLEIFFSAENTFKNIYQLRKYRHLTMSVSNPLFTFRELEHTIEIKLKHFEEQKLIQTFSSDCRRDINKSYLDPIQCTQNITLPEFYPLYHKFILERKLTPLSMDVFIQLNDCIHYSKATFENSLQCVHAHLISAYHKRVRLLASASVRLEPNIDHRIVARANKALTMSDLIYFTKKGLEIYDFGGYDFHELNHDLKGINQFKRKFGGEIVQLKTNYSIPYYLLYLLSKSKKRILHILKSKLND